MAVIGSTLSPAQETNLLNRFDQDEDLWIIFMTLFIRSKGEMVEELKEHFINSDSGWQFELKRTKEESFSDIKLLINEKTLQWNFRIKQLLADAGHVNILKLYLRSLSGLRMKKSSSDDSISASQRQINSVLSQLGGEISSLLDPYHEMARCVERNQTPGGKDLTDVSRAYYQSRQNDFFSLISTYLALILYLRLATTKLEVTDCQDLIRRNLVRPLESKIDTLDKTDKKEAWTKLDNYAKLIRSLEIQL